MLQLTSKRRFKPLDVGLALFLAGFVPTVLMGVITYTILKESVESSIIRGRHTEALTLARLVSGETGRPGDVLEYFRALPQMQDLVRRPPGDATVQTWLADALHSHPRLDGIFLTDNAGRLIGCMPTPGPAWLGKQYSTADWLADTRARNTAYVSPVHLRIPDNQLCTSIVEAIRGPDGAIEGYLGLNMLVQRIGMRLAQLDFGEKTVPQLIDQRGRPLFDANLQPNLAPQTEDPGLLSKIETPGQEHFQYQDNLITVQSVDGSNWTALLQQPIAVAYEPIRGWADKMLIIGTWLLVLYGVGSWLISWLYRKHIAAAERIARETSFSQTILASMPIGIALLDTGTRQILEANGKFIEMAREFGGADGHVNPDRFYLKDLPNLGIDDAVDRVTQSGMPFQTREQTVHDTSRRMRFLSVNLLRLTDAEQRTHGVLLLLEDVTHDVETRRELIAANTAKDQFLALLSHELRNPLSPVITMVSELDKMIDTVEGRNAIEIIRRNVELEARLIDDLLDITRIAHGKLQLTPETINAHRAIHRALEICQREIDARRLDVLLDLQAEAFHVNADPARFQQVLWNVIKNAVKFTPRGRITIRSMNDVAGRLIVEVEDTGIGISAERLCRIFKPFDQGETAITRKFGGLGLGLAISKAMIEAHGGALRVRSPGKDQGATFTVEMATVDAPVETEDILPAPAISGGTLQHKILLVDDHEDTCTGMRMILERRGYRVKVAHDVQGALAVAEDYPFELIISDLGLPDGTGFDLMKELRRRRGDSIRGVALSGFGMESDIDRSMEAGFEEHLIKPVNLERLGEILREVFGEPVKAEV